MRPLRIERPGRVRYGPMLARQRERHAEVLAGTRDDTLFLLEHERVITLGKNATDQHLLVSPERLAAHGYDLCPTERGGDVTYHWPGQLVGYPIVHLQADEREVAHFVWCLEEIMIQTAADFGVTAERVKGLRGVWVAEKKLGAVGVRISRWATLHGFALNVSTNLSAYEVIVPCGITGAGATSLAAQHDPAPKLDAVADRVAAHAGLLLDREPYEAGQTT